MAKKKEDEVKLTSTSYADLRGLNKFQRFALIRLYPTEEYTAEEWDEIAKKIDL